GESDWSGYIWLHERHFRLDAFNEIAPNLTDREYWNLLSQVWTDAETIWRKNLKWLMALTRSRTERERFMSDADCAFLKSLPDRFTVYRGYQPGKNEDGFSWTLSRKIAKKLSKNGKGANMFDIHMSLSGGKIRQKTVNRTDVFAYTNARNEQEVILLW